MQQTRYTNDFVNTKSHKREKPLLAGYNIIVNNAQFVSWSELASFNFFIENLSGNFNSKLLLTPLLGTRQGWLLCWAYNRHWSSSWCRNCTSRIICSHFICSQVQGNIVLFIFFMYLEVPLHSWWLCSCNN